MCLLESRQARLVLLSLPRSFKIFARRRQKGTSQVTARSSERKVVTSESMASDWYNATGVITSDTINLDLLASTAASDLVVQCFA